MKSVRYNQHRASFFFLPNLPSAITVLMYATASGTLQSVSPALTITTPISLVISFAVSLGRKKTAYRNNKTIHGIFYPVRGSVNFFTITFISASSFFMSSIS